MMVYGTIVADRKAAKIVGDADHIIQVRAFALVRSRAAFARALITAGLAGGSPAAVSRYLSDYGGESGNAQELATAQIEGQVYVNSMHGAREPIPWPPSQL